MYSSRPCSMFRQRNVSPGFIVEFSVLTATKRLSPRYSMSQTQSGSQASLRRVPIVRPLQSTYPLLWKISDSLFLRIVLQNCSQLPASTNLAIMSSTRSDTLLALRVEYPQRRCRVVIEMCSLHFSSISVSSLINLSFPFTLPICFSTSLIRALICGLFISILTLVHIRWLYLQK